MCIHSNDSLAKAKTSCVYTEDAKIAARDVHSRCLRTEGSAFFKEFLQGGRGKEGGKTKYFSEKQKKKWTSRFARSPKEGCFSDFKLTVTSDEPGESWVSPHLVAGSGRQGKF